jgi:glucose-1-phosphate cytidylyltransferase
MKVVLFCGGRGLRLREHSEAIPKPMVPVGYRPILWHVMRYYAHYGHRDFILCLGYRADAIKDYFLNYREAVSNDFVLSEGGRRIELLGSDIEDWRITFADTGRDTTIGERLRRVRHLLEGEEMFLANYGDIVTDAPLDELVERFRADSATAALLSVRPSYSFHVVDAAGDGRVTALRDVAAADLRINGGGYLLRREILDRLDSGEDLVDAPFGGLAAEGRLAAYSYDGFWVSLDTLKDIDVLQRLEEQGAAPWAVWRRSSTAPAGSAPGD